MSIIRTSAALINTAINLTVKFTANKNLANTDVFDFDEPGGAGLGTFTCICKLVFREVNGFIKVKMRKIKKLSHAQFS